jgi:lysophospholipase L1-like esterase
MVTPKETLTLSWKKQSLFSLIIVVLLLGMGEAVLRTWAFFFRTSYERYNFTAGRLELIPNIKYTTRSGDEFLINSRGFLGPEFDERPTGGVYRIIAIGDSCTFSGGIWNKAYPGILGNLLNNNRADRKYEVINGGIEGYNSTFALDRIEQEIVRYDPRLVIVYIGWNDLMKTNPDNLSNTGRYTFLSQFLERSYLVKAYSKVMFQYLRPLIFWPKVVASEGEERAFETFVPRAYEENLNSAIEILRQHGTKVILVTLPTVVHPRMTQEEIRKQHVFFPYFAGTYSVAKFLSLHKAYNGVVHAVGKKLSVPVVDLDQIFDSYGDQKSRLFWDTMHPSGEGHFLIAKSLFPIVQKELN